MLNIGKKVYYFDNTRKKKKERKKERKKKGRKKDETVAKQARTVYLNQTIKHGARNTPRKITIELNSKFFLTFQR